MLYHCLPSIFLNETIEFCGPNAAIEKGLHPHRWTIYLKTETKNVCFKLIFIKQMFSVTDNWFCRVIFSFNFWALLNSFRLMIYMFNLNVYILISEEDVSCVSLCFNSFYIGLIKKKTELSVFDIHIYYLHVWW